QRLQPGLHDLLHLLVPFEVEARDWRLPVVEIEIDRELITCGFTGISGEMCLDICFRAEQSLFFTAPDANADGATRFDADGFQDPQRLDHRRYSIRVVCRSRSRVPGIQVGARHYDFVADLRINATNFRDDVVSVPILLE